MDDMPVLIAINIETKNPKLLPRKNYFTNLVILEVHGRLIHAGVSHTLSYLRQEFWLPKGRAEVRRVLLQCVICNRHHDQDYFKQESCHCCP